MSQVHGYPTFFAWGKESTYGTPVAAAKYAEIEKEALREERKYAQKPILRTLSRNRKIKERMDPKGTITLPVIWAGLEQLLENVFGAGSVGTTGAGPFTHSFSLKAAVSNGLTVFLSKDADATGAGTCYQFPGSQIDKLTLTQAVGEWLMMELDIFAREQ